MCRGTYHRVRVAASEDKLGWRELNHGVPRPSPGGRAAFELKPVAALEAVSPRVPVPREATGVNKVCADVLWKILGFRV